MKKTLSILLTAVLLFASVFTVNAFAQEPKNLTVSLINKLNDSQEIMITFKSGGVNLLGGAESESFDTIAAKGNNVAYQFDASFLSVRAVMTNGKVYGFFPTLPYFYAKLDSFALKGVDVWEAVKEASHLTTSVLDYQKCYTETVDNTEYYVEEFNDRATVTSKFYYDSDNNLKILKVTDHSKGSVYYTYFESISFEVDDSFFEIPKAAIDVTPLLKWLFAMLIAA